MSDDSESRKAMVNPCGRSASQINFGQAYASSNDQVFGGDRLLTDQELDEFRLESLSVGAIVVCHFAQSTMRRACSTS